MKESSLIRTVYIAVFLSIFGIAAGVELSERIYKLESEVESLKKHHDGPV